MKGTPIDSYETPEPPRVTWTSGLYGTVHITHGKTAAARRVVPMTPRERTTLEGVWLLVKKSVEGWVWPAETQSGHAEPSTFRRAHLAAFDAIDEEATKHNRKPIRRFVLYSFRHTFLTRLAEGGVDAWTLAKIAGHSSIAISSRYVHPGEDAVLNAISRLGGHKIGHTPENAKTRGRWTAYNSIA
jgi:integrase